MKYITFHTSVELIRLSLDAVVYISADGNYSDIVMADGNKFTLTLQLGQIEGKIAELEYHDSAFVRLGKSLIINSDYIAHINTSKQKLILSDCRTFRYDVSASREALKKLKETFENEPEL